MNYHAQQCVNWWLGNHTPEDPRTCAPDSIVPYLQLTNTVVSRPSNTCWGFLNRNTGKNSTVAAKSLITDDDWKRAITDLL